MEVLLLFDVPNLGRQGDIVKVTSGYARNYLLPKNLVIQNGKGAQKQLSLLKHKIAKREKELISDAQLVKKVIDELKEIEVLVRTNEDNTLYGSITPSSLKELLKGKGVQVEPKQIKIAQQIKKVGEYEVEIELYKDKASLKLIVKPENSQGDGKE